MAAVMAQGKSRPRAPAALPAGSSLAIGSLVEHAFAGAARGAASRQVMAAMVAALVRTVAHGEECAEVQDGPEVQARMEAIRPVLRARVAEAAGDAVPPLGSVTRACRNVASHNFSVEMCGVEPEACTRLQRGARRRRPPEQAEKKQVQAQVQVEEPRTKPDDVDRMKAGQNGIYYITGEDISALPPSPFLDALRAKFDGAELKVDREKAEVDEVTSLSSKQLVASAEALLATSQLALALAARSPSFE